MQSITSSKSAISFLAPFVVYMICTSFEPEPSSGQYPYFYGVKLLLTAIAIAFCFSAWKSYLKMPSFYGVLAGIVGAAVWIGLCQIQKQSIPDFLPGMGLEQVFPSVRPGSEYHWGVEQNENGSVSISSIFPLFLVRLFGLAIIVPFIEEFFLRGFVLRYFWSEPKKEDKEDEEKSEPTPWYDVPIGALCPMVWAITIVYPLLTHPEALAGVVWFCGITLLAWKTRSLSDCICAHAITNLALGIWVLYSGQWGLL